MNPLSTIKLLMVLFKKWVDIFLLIIDRSNEFIRYFSSTSLLNKAFYYFCYFYSLSLVWLLSKNGRDFVLNLFMSLLVRLINVIFDQYRLTVNFILNRNRFSVAKDKWWLFLKQRHLALSFLNKKIEEVIAYISIG